MKKILYILLLLLWASASEAQGVAVAARQLQQTLGVSDADADEDISSIAEELGITDDPQPSLSPQPLPFQVPDTTLPLGWIPQNSNRLMNDLTGILTPAQQSDLEVRLLDCWDSSHVEIAVLLVPDLGGDAIESFTQNVWSKWHVGDKEKNNGVIIVIKPKNSTDGQLRIQTGYGMEGALPDAFCNRIINEVMIPHLRENDYYGALNAALDVIIPICNGEYSVEDYEAAHGDGVPVFVVIIIVIFIIVVIISFDKKNFSNGSSGSSWNGGEYYGGFGGFGGSTGSFGGGFGGGFGGFGGGFSGGGGASGRW